MKTLRFAIALTFATALLVGCTRQTAPSLSETASSTSDSQSSDPAASSASPSKMDVLALRYTDVSALPALDLNVEKVVQFDDRTLILEDSIDNELEYLVYQNYYYETAGDFSACQALIGDNEALQISNHNEEKLLEQGMYLTSITLHSLDTLTFEELDHATDSSKDHLLEHIDKYALTEYAIVQADLDWTYSQAMLEAGPQSDEGRYLRYFLLGKTEETPEFLWYELYWDDFLESA